ncbi:MAG: hydroxyethylthiazole kinase [Pseudomonadota bacterium]
MNTPQIDVHAVADCFDAFRASKPRVHCITNSVAQHFTANVLLAAGAVPSMTVAMAEIASFVESADALLINLGTLDPERRQAIELAVETSNAHDVPWGLDPVFVQASPTRLALASRLLLQRPAFVRCNRGEGEVLFEEMAFAERLQDIAKRFDTTLVVSGQTDLATSGEEQVSVANGHALMDRVTAMGCALTALMTGFVAVERNRLLATVSAVLVFGLAGERAAKQANGPGSFSTAILDALYNLDRETIIAEGRLS